jgi:hypothetical protein
MFPIAHAYLMTQLFPAPTPAHFLGCVWPDMLFTGPLTHTQTHKQGRELLAFVRRDSPELLPFCRAALTHMAEPHGFDWFSDEHYDPGAAKGYAFERARPFVAEVVRAARVKPEDGLWKAHNFVEMSFELALGQQYPELGRAVAAACAKVDLVAAVTAPLARHFNQPQVALAANIGRFPTTVALDRPTSLDLATAYAIQLNLKHSITDPDIPALADIIDRVWAAIAPDRDQFLATCVREVAAVLDI